MVGVGSLNPPLGLCGRIAPHTVSQATVSRDDSARGDGPAQRVRYRAVKLDRLDVLVDHRARVIDPQLGEQVGDLSALGGEDLVLRLEFPELAFEWPERLLAGAVDELLV